MSSPRERAARALCRLAGQPEDILFEGRSMWMSYLIEVDAVLKEALGEGVLLALRDWGRRSLPPPGGAGAD